MNFLIWPLIALLIISAILLARTFRFGRPRPPATPAEPIAFDLDAAAAHLATAIACQTISRDTDTIETEEFDKLHRRLAEMYPLVHTHLTQERIAEYSLLYTWPGSDPTLKPILLMAHQDVVPVDPTTAAQWEQEPFAGQIADGYVWGRGTSDCKGQLIGELEAVEYLLRFGYRPQRTVYLAFGHDEEVGGSGARAIAERLRARGVRLEAVIDEGGSVTEGMIPGVAGPVALIGNTEKGYLTLELTVTQPPGHAAMPPRHTAIGILARAIARLEAHPFPARLNAIMPMFAGIGPALPFGLRLVLANAWLFGPLIRSVMSRATTTNAAIRTTAAVTMVSGGVKENILPAHARALVNLRLLPGDQITGITARIKHLIGDEQVQVTTWPHVDNHEAPPPSSTDGPTFERLASTVRQIFGDIPVAPYTVIGATDARFYHTLCDNVYRFTPIVANKADMQRVHGVNERLSIDNLDKMIKFFIQLLRVWSAA